MVFVINHDELWVQYFHLYSPPGACVLRDASGNITDILIGNITDDCVGLGCQLGWNFTECTQSQTCEYGLANSSKVAGCSLFLRCWYLYSVFIYLNINELTMTTPTRSWANFQVSTTSSLLVSLQPACHLPSAFSSLPLKSFRWETTATPWW